MLKKWRIIVNKISKMRQTTRNWIKKILDEATRIVLISWFFYLFLLCSISLLVKYDFILRYEAWVNAIRASSFFENFPQISAKPIAFQRNLFGKLSQNRPFFANRFSAKLASKIPAKFPRNRPFFPRICPWKSREIRLFFPRPTRSPDYHMTHLTPLAQSYRKWYWKLAYRMPGWTGWYALLEEAVQPCIRGSLAKQLLLKNKATVVAKTECQWCTQWNWV